MDRRCRTVHVRIYGPRRHRPSVDSRAGRGCHSRQLWTSEHLCSSTAQNAASNGNSRMSTRFTPLKVSCPWQRQAYPVSRVATSRSSNVSWRLRTRQCISTPPYVLAGSWYIALVNPPNDRSSRSLNYPRAAGSSPRPPPKHPEPTAPSSSPRPTTRPASPSPLPLTRRSRRSRPSPMSACTSRSSRRPPRG